MKRAAVDHRRPFTIEFSVIFPDILLNTIFMMTIK
jgi:hypothetical protein